MTTPEGLEVIKRLNSDAVIIATQDRMHTEPSPGVGVLLEKPMAVEREDCIKIANAAKKRRWCFCNMSCYAVFANLCIGKKVLTSGLIGKVKFADHTEPVGHWSHSFVRGNWSNEALSTFSLMSKTCHDIDLLQ